MKYKEIEIEEKTKHFSLTEFIKTCPNKKIFFKEIPPNEIHMCIKIPYWIAGFVAGIFAIICYGILIIIIFRLYKHPEECKGIISLFLLFLPLLVGLFFTKITLFSLFGRTEIILNTSEWSIKTKLWTLTLSRKKIPYSDIKRIAVETKSGSDTDFETPVLFYGDKGEEEIVGVSSAEDMAWVTVFMNRYLNMQRNTVQKT